ncbi:MAG: transposase [Patescibacteria group bacterium]
MHAIKRGARGLPIVQNIDDRRRFLRILYYMNDEFLDPYWELATRSSILYTRLDSWPKRKRIVDILAYTLMPNHIHLLLKEIRDGGISEFMKKIGQSMSNHHNEKYNQHGSIFQGSYRGRTVESDEYLRYVAAYIMVKNTFELYPRGGLRGAIEHFEEAWKWGTAYSFSSLGDYAGVRKSPILERGILDETFSPRTFKSFCRDVIEGSKWLQSEFE